MIRAEGVGFHHDLVASRGRAVEREHKEVEVHGEAVHDHYFIGRSRSNKLYQKKMMILRIRAICIWEGGREYYDYLSGEHCDRLIDSRPGSLTREVALHTHCSPFCHLL
jgi:hypothetical protein